MSDAYDRLIRAQQGAHSDTFAPKPAQMRLTVTAVETDSMGNPTIARGTEEGAGPGSAEFSVQVFGRAQVEVGEVILGEYDKTKPASASLTYAGHVASTLPGVGSQRTALGPTPEFAPTWNTLAPASIIGAVASVVTIYFLAVPAKYKPSRYIVSYRIAGAKWADVPVPGDGVGTLECELPRSFGAGVTINVKLRAEYAISYGPSLESETRSVVTAADTVTPGAASALAVDATTAGRLLLLASGTVDMNRFDAWRYEVATSAGGAGLILATMPGQFDFIGAAGNYYVAVRPVSKSGVLGTRFPASGFNGPYALTPAAAPLDTTAPPTWGAPTVTPRTNITNDGVSQGYVKVAFPAYSYPADYAETIVNLTNGTTENEQRVIYDGSANGPIEFPVDFGSWTVTLIGVDKTGNRSVASPTAVASVVAPGIPSAAANVTTASISLAVRVMWTLPTNAQWARVWRASDAAGTGAAVPPGGDRVNGTSFIDSFAATGGAVAGQVWYYKIEGRNPGGGGTLSPTWIAGTVGAYDGANAAANSYEANVLKAVTTLTSLLRTATSGARLEVEGATGGGAQMQIRAYETISAVTYLRWAWLFAGVEFYTNTGSIRGKLTKDGVVVNRDSGAARMVLDGTGLYLYNDSAVLRTTMDKDGISIGNDSAAGRVILIPKAGGALQILTDEVGVLSLGSTAAGTIGIGYALLSAAQVAHIVAPGLGIYFSGAGNGGTMGEWYRLQPDGGISWGTGGTLQATIRRINDRFGNADAIHFVNGGGNKARIVAGDMHSIRSTAANQGIIWLGDGSGGDRYIFWNGANYVLPGAQATINGVNVGSARSTKKGIKSHGIDLAKARTLQPRRYTLRGGPTDAPERLGFVAEEVAEAIPAVAVDLSESLDQDGNPVFGGLAYSLEGMVAAQAALISDLYERLERLEAATK